MPLRASAKWGRPVACGRRIRRPPSLENIPKPLTPCAAQLQSRDRKGAVLRASALLVLFTASLSATPRFSFHVLGNEPGGWGELLSSVGLTAGPPATAGVFIAPQGTAASASEWTPRIEQGAILVLEGESPLAAAFGFRPGAEPHVMVQNVEDLRAPALRIIWEKALDLPVFQVPSNARVFARERWRKAPLMAGYRSGA